MINGVLEKRESDSNFFSCYLIVDDWKVLINNIEIYISQKVDFRKVYWVKPSTQEIHNLDEYLSNSQNFDPAKLKKFVNDLNNWITRCNNAQKNGPVLLWDYKDAQPRLPELNMPESLKQKSLPLPLNGNNYGDSIFMKMIDLDYKNPDKFYKAYIYAYYARRNNKYGAVCKFFDEFGIISLLGLPFQIKKLWEFEAPDFIAELKTGEIVGIEVAWNVSAENLKKTRKTTYNKNSSASFFPDYCIIKSFAAFNESIKLHLKKHQNYLSNINNNLIDLPIVCKNIIFLFYSPMQWSEKNGIKIITDACNKYKIPYENVYLLGFKEAGNEARWENLKQIIINQYRSH